MNERFYNTTQITERTGIKWYTLLKMANKGVLPTARLLPGRKIGRWCYTDEDIEFLNRFDFYRSQGYEYLFALAKVKADFEVKSMTKVE